MEKAIVLYSGGLDSRLVVKILQNQGFSIEALFFSLPFGCGCCNEICNFKFTQMQDVKLTIFDCNKGKLLKQYLNVLKNPKHGTGAGINPCKDCKIFMFKKAKEYADKRKIKVIATGEVLGERPMSQTLKAMKIIDEEIGFEILRPLSAKLLPETEVEKQGIVDRKKFFDIQGRSRKRQIQLAKKFGIRYPSPAGGCLLCEKVVAKRLKLLLDKNLINEKNLPLTKIGRHFYIKDNWFVVARNEEESKIIEQYKNSIKSGKGKPSVYYHKIIGKKTAEELQKAYQNKKPDKFIKFKI